HILVLLAAAIGAYAVLFLVTARLSLKRAHIVAACLAAAALSAYWLWFDGSLHGNQRYPMRTVLLLGTAAFGLVAAGYALAREGRLKLRGSLAARAMLVLESGWTARAAAGALLVVVLVHAVETAKFVRVWTAYTAAVRTLAMSSASDRALGDVH